MSEELSNPLEEHQFAYSLGWKDQLVKVDNEVITYDTMGRMNKIGNDVLTWNGKGQLTSYKDTSFTYDVRNLRRTKGNLTYYYDGNGHILGEKGTKSINGVNQEIEIIYTYNMDKITGFVYNGVGYFYLRNIQGDILSIYKSEDSSLVASYQYDAWGNQTVTNYGEENIGNINPIRYRGYYYDEETGLYYLNSRYYDPRLRRFISPDTLSILDETMSEINGLNLYMYCKDNPVMYVDPSGNMAWLILAAFLFIGITRAATNAIGQYQTSREIDWFEVAVEGIYGGIMGILTVTTVGTFSVIKLAVKIGVTAIAMGLKDGLLIYNDTRDINKAGMAGLQGLIKGGLVGFASYVAFTSANVTQLTFASSAAVGMIFGYFSGIKDKNQKIKWPLIYNLVEN